MYSPHFEKYIYKIIDLETSIPNFIKKYLIYNVLKTHCIKLRQKEHTIEMNDLIENLLRGETLADGLSIINFCYYLLSLEIRNEEYTLAETFIQYKIYYEELYDRNLFYYRSMNKYGTLDFNNIKIISVIKHNQCVEYVYKNYRDALPTVLTFDSHRDVQGVKSKQLSMEYFEKCQEETIELNRLLYKSIPFIGSVLYPMLLPYTSNNGIIFVGPVWCNHKQTTDPLFIDRKLDNNNNSFNSKLDFISNDDSSIDNMDEINYITCNTETFDETKFQITDGFILNIDLDYFCANGDSCVLKNSSIHDIMSPSRTIVDSDHSKNPHYINTVVRDLNTEICEIRKRIDKFMSLCLKIKKSGKKPSMIIFSDSTDSPFSEPSCIEDKETMFKCNNNFTPKYLILWIKTTVYNHLKDMFDA